MNRENVQSSALSSIGYEAETSILEIEFNKGGIYQYFDVPENVYFEMKNSDSLGKFFLTHIKKQYVESQVG